MSRSYRTKKTAATGASRDHLTLNVTALLRGDEHGMVKQRLVTKSFGTQSPLKAHLRSLVKALREDHGDDSTAAAKATLRIRALTQPLLTTLQVMAVQERWELLRVVIDDNSKMQDGYTREKTIYRRPLPDIDAEGGPEDAND